jgi:hypothetical protein
MQTISQIRLRRRIKWTQGGCNPNVSPKEDPVGAMTIEKLKIIIREHQIIMLVNEGGHSHMRRSPLTDSLQICQDVAHSGSKTHETVRDDISPPQKRFPQTCHH